MKNKSKKAELNSKRFVFLFFLPVSKSQRSTSNLNHFIVRLLCIICVCVCV